MSYLLRLAFLINQVGRLVLKTTTRYMRRTRLGDKPRHLDIAFKIRSWF